MFTLLVLLFILEIFKKKSSENDRSSGHFQIFFRIFFVLDPKSEKKNSCKTTNKKILALVQIKRSVQKINNNYFTEEQWLSVFRI